MHEVKKPSDIPAGHHYAIIVFKTESIHHEADEESKRWPGHGYGAYTQHIPTFTYWVTEDMGEAKAKLETLYRENAQREDVLFQEINRTIVVSPTVVFQLDVR